MPPALPASWHTYLHHLGLHIEDVEPVTEAGVAVELWGPLAGSHAELALPLLANVPHQLGLWEKEG